MIIHQVPEVQTQESFVNIPVLHLVQEILQVQVVERLSRPQMAAPSMAVPKIVLADRIQRRAGVVIPVTVPQVEGELARQKGFELAAHAAFTVFFAAATRFGKKEDLAMPSTDAQERRHGPVFAAAGEYDGKIRTFLLQGCCRQLRTAAKRWQCNQSWVWKAPDFSEGEQRWQRSSGLRFLAPKLLNKARHRAAQGMG